MGIALSKDILKYSNAPETGRLICYLASPEEANELDPGESESEADSRRSLTRGMWRGRLRGVQRNVEVWQALLSVRSLVLPRHEDVHTWLKFASLARKSGRIRLSLF